MNGTHTDSLGPDTISRWLEFLDIYVAGEVPTPVDRCSAARDSALYSGLTGARPRCRPRRPLHHRALGRPRPSRPSPPQDPRVRVLFDNGGGSLGPGALQPAYTAGFSAWPPAGTVTRFHLGPAAALDHRRHRSGASTATLPPRPVGAAGRRPAPSANAWAAQPPYDWTPVPAANGIAFQNRRLHQGHHHRRSRQPRPDAQVDGPGHRPAGHGDRGRPNGTRPGAVPTRPRRSTSPRDSSAAPTGP